MNSKKTIYILILILTIGIVGLTIAYFANSSTITNTFNTNPYGTTVTEEFVSPDNWLPGTSTDKSLTVTNSGQVDEAVRISYTESWTSRSAKNNNEEGDLPLQQNGNTAALIHFTNTDDWTTVEENGTTYRYYNYKLEPNQTTSELLDYVTFNSAITNSSNCTTRDKNGTKTITCNSTGTGYDDATYKLTFTIETIQYNKYKEAWNTNVNIASTKPMNASQLALKSNPVSITNYTDGNIHEMYTFEHPATEQTPALTDYRYIGNDPYNYVYFNCDDLSNQNSETCEVWRIIGVFDVDDVEGNWETRMKLVRGNPLSPSIYDWDINSWNGGSNNDWISSKIKNYLNNIYFNETTQSLNYGLKMNIYNMIENSKYYLGGFERNNSTISSNDMYMIERSNNVYNNNSNYWYGKIGLIYLSDYYFAYSNGVDQICYNTPKQCIKFESATVWENNVPVTKMVEKENPGYPEKSWIYESNETTFNNNSFRDGIWSITAVSDNEWEVFRILNDFNAANTGNYLIRPTLYLSSSVKIIDGDGSINNPYKLSNS